MKKVTVILAGVFFLLISSGADAQSKAVADSLSGEAYFIGKWNILAKSLPQGDTKMVIIIEKKEGKLTGNISDPASSEGPMEFTSVTINGNVLSAVFTAQGMDIPLDITKKDDKNITGNIMGMFDIEGSRPN